MVGLLPVTRPPFGRLDACPEDPRRSLLGAQYRLYDLLDLLGRVEPIGRQNTPHLDKLAGSFLACLFLAPGLRELFSGSPLLGRWPATFAGV